MTFQAGAALPCRPTVAHSKHAIGMAVGMGVLWKQLTPVKDRMGQDCSKDIDRVVCLWQA